MKSPLILLVTLSLFLGACASRGAKVMSPEKVAHTNQKWAENQAKYKMRLGLSCPFGGEDAVVVDSRLGDETRHLGVANAAKSIFRRPVFVLRAKNSENGLIDIEDTQGIVVKNLCPGGSITLAKSMPPVSNGHISVFWMANGINASGELGQDISPTGSLWNNSWQYRRDANWIVRLEKQTGRFFDRKEKKSP